MFPSTNLPFIIPSFSQPDTKARLSHKKASCWEIFLQSTICILLSRSKHDNQTTRKNWVPLTLVLDVCRKKPQLCIQSVNVWICDVSRCSGLPNSFTGWRFFSTHLKNMLVKLETRPPNRETTTSFRYLRAKKKGPFQWIETPPISQHPGGLNASACRACAPK